jgi:hypothetical protein
MSHLADKIETTNVTEEQIENPTRHAMFLEADQVAGGGITNQAPQVINAQ